MFGWLWGEVGYDMLVVAMGWPHVFLGFIFYFNKVIKGQSPHRFYFWILILLTLLICFFHTLTPMTTLIYVYFVFHALRDEIFIYRQRQSHFRSTGPIFNAAGATFLIAVIFLSAPEQVSLEQSIHTVRKSSEDLKSERRLLFEFPPIGDSKGKEFYFTVTAPGTEGSTSLKTFGTAQDTYPGGELLIGGERWSLKDLQFRLQYEGRPSMEETANSRTSADMVPLLLTGGHSVGQTFSAEWDGLKGISIPIEADSEAVRDFTVWAELKSAFASQYPFAEEGTVLLFLVMAGFLSILGRPAWLCGRYPEAPYFIFLLILFQGVQVLMEMGRHYSFGAPLFFSFLVVFHYFSWYVFSLERVAAAPGMRPVQKEGLNFLERFLLRLRTRRGFVNIVILLNLISLAGVLAYYSGQADWLKYAFDLKYFLYFLVFHVTMSFAPKKKPAAA